MLLDIFSANFDMGPVVAAIVALLGVSVLFFAFVKYANTGNKEAVAQAKKVAEDALGNLDARITQKNKHCRELHEERDRAKRDTFSDLKVAVRGLDTKLDETTNKITEIGTKQEEMYKQIRVLFKKVDGAV